MTERDYLPDIGKLIRDSVKLASWWWLRSPGNNTNNAANINSDGSLNNNNVNNNNGGVRPALPGQPEAKLRWVRQCSGKGTEFLLYFMSAFIKERKYRVTENGYACKRWFIYFLEK